MYQVTFSPVLVSKAKNMAKQLEEPNIVSLALFTPNPKIFFEDIPVGSEKCHKLIVKNPSNHDVQVHISKAPPEERNVEFSWGKETVPASGEIILEIFWQPTAAGGWRDVLTLSCGPKIRKDIAITFKSIKKVNKTLKKINKSPVLKIRSKAKSPNKYLHSKKTPPKLNTSRNKENVPCENFRPGNKSDTSRTNTSVDKVFAAIENTSCRMSNILQMPERRGTFTVGKVTTPKLQKHMPIPEINFEDSLEVDCEEDSFEVPRNEQCYRKQGKKQKCVQFEEVNNCKNTNVPLADRIQNLHFEGAQFTPATPLVQTFHPNACSSEMVSRFNKNELDLMNNLNVNTTFNAIEENISGNAANLSSSTYVKGNISAETYVKGNISSETYVKSNLSSETYVKSNLSSETYVLGNVSGGTYVVEKELSPVRIKDIPCSIGTWLDHTNEDTIVASNVKEAGDGIKYLEVITEESLQHTPLFCRTSIKKDIFSNFTPQNALECTKVIDYSITATDHSRMLSVQSAKKIIEANEWANHCEKETTDTKHSTSATYFESSVKKSRIQNKRKINEVSFISPSKQPRLELRKEAENISTKRRETWTKTGVPNINRYIQKQQFESNNHEGEQGYEKFATKTSKTDGNTRILHDPDAYLQGISNPFLLSATNVDPFMTATMFYDPKWMDQQELYFKKWLNALLTPPLELTTNTEVFPVDVAKIWQECKRKNIASAPTKEAISLKYNTNSKLDSLRRACQKLFQSPDICTVLSKVCMLVENNRLSVREDKNIHTNLGLQSEMMELLLSFNPLWLRIGLETIFGVTINMQSNSDVLHLSTFIKEHLFKDDHLLRKYKSKLSKEYSAAIKKHILKKFLMLIFFLDQAKARKLIGHDPCLFCKNAPYKETREILIKFAREVLSCIGDITKYLKYSGYIVSHKQMYIHEFNYAVECLGSDLRDGVRLARVMEIILLKDNLTAQLRVPAISRLQKIHNMKVVFEALHEANLKILWDITPKDIVDSHKEKTLSFLWQIVYKFQEPRINKAANTIQSWWRSLKIVVKRRYLYKRHVIRENAATIIQRWYRKISRARYLEAYQEFTRKENAAVKIQSSFKMLLVRKWYLQTRKAVVQIQCHIRRWLVRRNIEKKILAIVTIQASVRTYLVRQQFLKIKTCTIFVQRKFRATQQMRQERRDFLDLKNSAIIIQKRFRALKQMKVERYGYIKIKAAAVVIQQNYRAYLLMKTERQRFLELKNFTICVQRRFRAMISMKSERSKYLELRTSGLIIQRRFRAYKLMKVERQQYVQLKNSVVLVQAKFRALKMMRFERNKYLQLRNLVLNIQQKFRANQIMKSQRHYYLKLRASTVYIQRKFRAKKVMGTERRAFLELKYSTTLIQRQFRAMISMKFERNKYLELRTSVLIIQRRFRANKLMKLERQQFLQLKDSVVLVQAKFRALKMMRFERNKYLQLRNSVLNIQQKFRANQTMKSQRQYYLKLRASTVYIQRKFRAKKVMKTERKAFLELKYSTTFIQRRFRAMISMKSERSKYLELRKSVVLIQEKFRALKLMKVERLRFVEIRRTTLFIQSRFRALQLMKIERQQYLELKDSVIFVQTKFRALRIMKSERNKYLEIRKSVVLIQQRFRANQIMKSQRQYYLKLRASTVYLQRKFRAKKVMIIERKAFLELKYSTTFIQRQFRALISMKLERSKYLELRKSVVLIQERFRALKLMKVEKLRFVEVRRTTVFIQSRFRALQLMKIERQQYLQLKNSVIFVQTKFRALRIMKYERSKYLELRKSVDIIQQRFRANQLMKSQRQYYLKLRAATVYLQRKFRAKKVMIIERKAFLELKYSTTFIQRRFRAMVSMKSERSKYLELRKSVLLIQERFRALKLMKVERLRYVKVRRATLFIQSKFRALQIMKIERQQYLQLKESVIFVQTKYRALRIMKSERNKYLEIRKSVVLVQQRFRANQIMKLRRQYYLKLKEVTLFIQSKFIARQLMKEERCRFLEMRNAACEIQKWFRSRQLLKNTRQEFLETRKCVIFIQQRFRANVATRKARRDYLELRGTVIYVQRIFRSHMLIKKERAAYLKMQQASITIQRWYRYFEKKKKIKSAEQIRERAIVKIQAAVRGFLVRNVTKDIIQEGKQKRKEQKKQKVAATKIQAVWRGYITRKTSKIPDMEPIRNRLVQANQNATVENTLAKRRDRALLYINGKFVTVLQIVKALEDLEYVTRRDKDICLKMSKLAPKMYVVIKSSIRSVPEMKAAGIATSILLNFSKYEPCSARAWIPEHFDDILTIMNNCCDKENPLFSYLCTLLWHYSDVPNFKRVILKIPLVTKRLHAIKNKIIRMHSMVCKGAYKGKSIFLYDDKYLPNRKPDWGLDFATKPRAFTNPQFAMSQFLNVLQLDV